MTKVVVENMRPPTLPVRQARPNWPNVSTQMLTHADAQWPSYRLAAVPLGRSPSVLLAEHTYSRASAESASVHRLGTARQAGFPERFVEVMSACWDSGSSRLKNAATLRLYARPPNPSCQRKAASTIHGQEPWALGIE